MQRRSSGRPQVAADSRTVESRRRRRVLAATGAALSGAVAGCNALDGLAGDDAPESYERLQLTAVHVADEVDVSVPGEVSTVDARNNADLLVIPGDTDTGAEQAVEWLADGRVLALLGDSAEGTWLEWTQSDAYGDTFDNQGYSDSEPDPDLLVAAAVDLRVTTYRHTWGNGPRDRDVLRALDEALVDIEQRRADA